MPGRAIANYVRGNLKHNRHAEVILRIGKRPALIRVRQKLHVDGDFQLEYINAIARSGKLPRQFRNLLRFHPGESQALLVSDAIAVADYLQEEGDVMGAALSSDTLYKGMFHDVDRYVVVGIIVDQHFDGICTSLDNARDRQLWLQRWESPPGCCVVARYFICEKQASPGGALFGCLQSILGIEQYRARVGSKDLRHQRLELHNFGHRDMSPGEGCQGLLERSALVYGQGRNDATLIG